MMAAEYKTSRALAKNVMLSPQKGRLVADLIRGLPVEQALERLHFKRKKAAGIIKNVLNSAIANAENNDGANIDNLVVCRIEVTDGVKLKRINFGARGHVNRIIRRRCHVLLEVCEKRKEQ